MEFTSNHSLPGGRYWYHGTTEENAELILRNGFLPGTYFAQHLEDALAFGGNFIFWVYFPESPTSYWEHVSHQHVPPDRIFQLLEIKKEVKYYSENIERLMRHSFLTGNYGENTIICDICDGKGETNSFPPYTRKEDRCGIIVCEKCHGYGVVR